MKVMIEEPDGYRSVRYGVDWVDKIPEENEIVLFYEDGRHSNENYHEEYFEAGQIIGAMDSHNFEYAGDFVPDDLAMARSWADDVKDYRDS